MGPNTSGADPATGGPPGGQHRQRQVRLAAKAAVGSAAFAAGLLLLGGTAHADDTTTTTTPAPAPNPAGDSLWVPATPAPGATAPAATTATTSAPTDTSTPAPSTGTSPATAGATTPAPTDTSTTTPTAQNTQGATVGSTGTGVSNSGGNTALGNVGAVQADPCPTSGTQATVVCTTTPTSGAGVTSGSAGAQGTNSTGGISQLTKIAATGNGQVDVLQVALIINIGVGVSNSGANAAGAAGGNSLGAAGDAKIGTGNVDVTGLLGNTQIVQGVTVVGGSANDQSVTVVNIGIGVGNSGTNYAAGTVLGNGTQNVVAAGPPGNGAASIGTGDTKAVGDNSGSLIMQVVTVTAGDNGSITVTQRAVIVNFGLALANSGGNTALSAMNGLPAAQRTLIEGLIAALFGLDPATLFGGGSAAIGTGTASAVGNQSQSSITQAVNGSVGGTDTATANQSAWIGNFGAALANSGLNGAAGTVALLPDGSPMGNAEQMISRFLQLLSNPSALKTGNTQLGSALDLGSALLNLQGNINGTETLAGLNESNATLNPSSGGRIRIRQMTGVLNIGISLANSGDNLATSFVSGANPLTPDPAASQVLGRATILTGPVSVLGERSTVCVTQIIGNSADFARACPPPVTPVTPGTPAGPPVAVEAARVTAPAAALPATLAKPAAAEAVAAASSLPFTGANLALEALLGLTLTGGGVLIQRRARRASR